MASLKTLAFVGAGQMAGALMKGILEAGVVSAKDILACDVRGKLLKQLGKALKVRTSRDNAAALKADAVIFGVKPQQMKEVLEEIGPRLSPKQLVISIAAGIPISWLERFVAPQVPVIRAMPNTPALVGHGMTVLARGSCAAKNHGALAMKLFSSVGVALEAPESWMDAVTAVSGSGPAYVFYVAEMMATAGVRLGLPPQVAEMLARQTIGGAAAMLKELSVSPRALRVKVTSTGGTTEAAFEVLERRQFEKIFSDALARAKERSEELSKLR